MDRIGSLWKVSKRFPELSTVQFISAKLVDSAFFWSLIFICVPSMAPAMFGSSENSSNVAMEAPVSCDWHMWLKNILLSHYVHAWQIENLAETNFVEIFGRAKQILSFQCARTLKIMQFLNLCGVIVYNNVDGWSKPLSHLLPYLKTKKNDLITTNTKRWTTTVHYLKLTDMW